MTWSIDEIIRSLILIFDRFCYGAIHIVYYVGNEVVLEYDDMGPARGRKAFLFIPRPLSIVEIRIGEVCYTALSDGEHIYEAEVWQYVDTSTSSIVRHRKLGVDG